MSAAPGSAGSTAPRPPRRRRAGAIVAVGVGVLVAALAGAVALWLLAAARYEDNVAAFARAPVGCDTTLQFDGSGEFVLYLETTGTVAELDGDCEVEPVYERADTGLPRPQLALRNDDGAVELAPTGGVDYDTGGFVGTAYRLADVPDAGDYVLTVDDEAAEPYAVAVGGDPRAGVSALRWGAGALVAAGLVVAGLCFLLAGRRPPPSPPVVTRWAPEGPTGPQYAGWPSGPPNSTSPPWGDAPPSATPPEQSPGPSRMPGDPLWPPSPWAPPTSEHRSRRIPPG